MFTRDNFFTQALNKIGDLFIINILFVITSLPIITIGASFSAMSYCNLSDIRQPSGYLIKKYFKAFKDNFKQATIMELLLLVAFYVIYFNISNFSGSDNFAGKAILYGSIFIGILLVVFALFYFPVIATFQNKMNVLITDTILHIIGHLPKAVGIFFMWFIPLYLTSVDTELNSLYVFVWAFMGFGLLNFFTCTILYSIFKKHLPEPEAEDEFLPETNEEYEKMLKDKEEKIEKDLNKETE